MAVRWVVPEGCPLTPRQLETLAWLATGRDAAAVAEKMGLVAHTVRDVSYKARQRLNAGNNEAAVLTCWRRGWFGVTREPDWTSGGARTSFQRAYLDAFDEHLHDRTLSSRRRMRAALHGMADEAGHARTLPPPVPDPLDRLARALGLLT
jgi:DNA-binding CsgD family transcriptional regulator